MPRSALIRLLVAAAALAVTTPDAIASTVALQPIGARAYYKYRVAPGAVIHGKIRVTNRGTRTASARLYGVDAATGPTTGATYVTEPGAGRRVGPWIRLGVRSVRLAPRHSRVVPFTVRVPDGVRSGDHLGGITADAGVQRGRPVKRGQSSFRVNVRTVTVIAVKLTVPGPSRPTLELTGVRAGGMKGYQQIMVGIANTGNALVKGHGALVVRTKRGRVMKMVEFPVDTFVPRTRVADPILLRGRPLAAGSYNATIAIRYRNRRISEKFRFQVGKAELAQVYGSPPPAKTRAEERSASRVGYIVGGSILALLALIATSVVTRRRALRRARAEIARELELAQREPDESDLPRAA